MLTLPDLPARIKILNMHLKEISHSLNEKEMSQLANNTERYGILLRSYFFLVRRR